MMLKKLVSKYQRLLKLDTALAVFSILSYLTTKLVVTDNLFFNLMPIYPLSIVFLSTCYIAVKELYIRLKSKSQLIDYIKTAHYQCKILNDDGDLNVTNLISIKNISRNTITWLPEENIRIGTQTDSKIPTTITSQDPNRKILIDYSYSFEEEIEGQLAYNHVWRPKLDPGLEKFSSFSYEWTIDNIKECEKDAFEGKGIIHMKINQFYEKFSFEIIAPPNFKIFLIRNYVVNFNKQEISEEIQRMNPPSFNKVQNIMIITQHRPRPKAIYFYRYKLEHI
jgi:hypothetical protein